MPYSSTRSKRIAEIPKCDIVRINGKDINYRYLLKLLKMEETQEKPQSTGVKWDTGNTVRKLYKAARQSTAKATTETIKFAGGLMSKPLKATSDLLGRGSKALHRLSKPEPEGTL